MFDFPVRLLLALAVGLSLGLPAWAADASCQFRARGLSINFGALDPSSPTAVTVPVVSSTSFANMAGDCDTAGSMSITLVGSATRQLIGPGGGSISYTITGLPVSLPKPGNAPPGNPGSGYVAWFAPGQLQASIQASAYADAPAGSYSDSVTVSISP